MPTNEVLRNAIRLAKPMKRAATFNVSAVGKRSIAYEGRARMIGPVKSSNPKTGETDYRMVARPFSERFSKKGVTMPSPKKR
jgi:hypothetical protein